MPNVEANVPDGYTLCTRDCNPRTDSRHIFFQAGNGPHSEHMLAFTAEKEDQAERRQFFFGLTLLASVSTGDQRP